MYAAVTTGQIQPDKIDEVERIGQETVVPILKTIPGLKRRYGMIERTTGRYVVVNLYDTEEAARAAGTSEQNQQIVAALGPFLIGQPEREVYEVAHEFEV